MEVEYTTAKEWYKANRRELKKYRGLITRKRNIGVYWSASILGSLSVMYLCPAQAQKYGYHPKTLADWADDGKISEIVVAHKNRLYRSIIVKCSNAKKDIQLQPNQLKRN